MSEISDRLDKKAAEEKLLNSLILELTKSGKLPWERCRFGIYKYVTRVGEYTFKLLKADRSPRITIYISTQDAEKDLHADGKEVWYFLTGKNEYPDREKLIQKLTFRKGTDNGNNS